MSDELCICDNVDDTDGDDEEVIVVVRVLDGDTDWLTVSVTVEDIVDSCDGVTVDVNPVDTDCVADHDGDTVTEGVDDEEGVGN